MPNSRQPRPLGQDTKPAVKSRVLNDFNKGRSLRVTEMSPEAKKAMLLTKMEPKENVTTQANTTKTPKSNASKSYNLLTGLEHRSAARHSNKPAPSSFDSGINVTTTTTSRSTLSYTTKTFSVSDHNDSCDNFVDGSRNNANSGVGRHSKVTALKEGGDLSVTYADFFRHGPERKGGDCKTGETLEGENGFLKQKVDDNENFATNTNSMFPRSFVMALDRALDEQCIRRLQGDITDTMGISEKGKVRALNGGRLANAQEVVVNVCHDDDKEIIFHDDDDESLETAKTISHIRVNIWMEFNEDFEPEHDTVSELDYPTITNDDMKTDNAIEQSDFLKVTNKERKTSRERKSPANKNLAKNAKTINSTNGKDSNNNTRSIGSSRSKTGTNLSSLDASSKNGSVFTEDTKFSKTWSKKPDTGFFRLAQK